MASHAQLPVTVLVKVVGRTTQQLVERRIFLVATAPQSELRRKDTKAPNVSSRASRRYGDARTRNNSARVG